jgi:hypothetical protein
MTLGSDASASHYMGSKLLYLLKPIYEVKTSLPNNGAKL